MNFEPLGKGRPFSSQSDIYQDVTTFQCEKFLITNVKCGVPAGLHLALKHRRALLSELDVVEVPGEGGMVVHGLHLSLTSHFRGLQCPDLSYG